MIRHCIVVVIIFSVAQLTGQIRSLPLLDNTYNSFAYSDEANLWISSQGGWNKYDGLDTYHYAVNDTVSGLKGEWIQSSLYEDDSGRKWTCTYDHLCYYTESADRFFCTQPVLNGDTVKQGVRLLGIDAGSQRPLVKAGGTLCYYDAKTNLLAPFAGKYTTRVPLFSYVDESTLLGYGGVESQLIELWTEEDGKWNSSATDFADCSQLGAVFASDGVTVDGEVYLASNKGLMIFNGNNPCASRILPFQKQDYKSYHLVHKDGFLLVTTDKFGILCYDIGAKAWVESVTADHPIVPLSSARPIELANVGPDIMVSYRNVDPQFIQWSELLPSLRMMTTVGATKEIKDLAHQNGFSAIASTDDIIDIYRDNKLYDQLQASVTGSFRNLHILDDVLYFHDESKFWKYELLDKELAMLYEDRSNALQEVFYYENRAFGVIENRAYEIINGNAKAVLTDEYNKDIICYTKLSEQVAILCKYNELLVITSSDTVRVEVGSYIFDHYYDSVTKTLLLALGNGLGMYDLRSESFTVPFLNGTRINSINAQNTSRILVATANGVYHYDGKVATRLPVSKQNTKEVLQIDSTLYCITGEGFYGYPLRHLAEVKRSRLYVFDENYSHTSTKKGEIIYRYQYDQPTLQLSFRTDSYQANEHGMYSYKIAGYAYEQTEQSLDRPMQLPPLSPGRYTIVVSGTDEMNEPLIPLHIAVEVKGPLWLKWWFVFSVASGALLLLWYFYKRQTTRLRRELALAEEMRQLEKSALQAQMNPHFIFNCLNSIQSFIMDNDKENAMDYLGRFAQLIRANLNASIESAISLEEEVSILMDYLSLEQLRLNEAFDFSIELDPKLNMLTTLIPPMLVQPFVENAVIHGMRHVKSDGRIDIRFYRIEGKVGVDVQDNGSPTIRPEKVAGHKSVGVDITKRRLAHINQSSIDQVDVNITHTSTGTVVNLRISTS